jgi:hypothetical protein
VNRWKAAFFVALAVWLVTLAGGVYLVVDSAVTTGYLSEGYADCEVHRDFLHALAKGSVDGGKVHAVPPITRSANGFTRAVDGREITVQYDRAGRYASSTFGASTTVGR